MDNENFTIKEEVVDLEDLILPPTEQENKFNDSNTEDANSFETVSGKSHRFKELFCESVHEGIKPYKCKICYFETAEKKAINKHIESIHEGIKAFNCNICGFKTAWNSDLKRHTDSVHEGIKRFKCNICDFKTNQNSNLNRHKESVHEGIKPFKCSVCDVKFANRQNLKKHVCNVRKREIEPLKFESVEQDKSNDNILTESLGDFVVSKTINNETDENPKTDPTQCDALIEVEGNLNKIASSDNRKRTQNETTIYDEVILPKRSKSSQGNTNSRFEDRSNIESKQEKDYKERCNQCVYCCKNYSCQGSLIEHLKKIHKVNIKATKKTSTLDKTKYICKDCDKRFMSLETAQKHYETVCGQRCNLWSQCLYCCKSYSSQGSLVGHLKKVHKVNIKVTKKASTLSKLNETETKYFCNDCDNWFVSLETAQKHYETVCGQMFDLDEGACDCCNEVFLSNTELQVHKYDHHMVNLEKAAKDIRDLRSEIQKSSNDQVIINQDSKIKRPPNKPSLFMQCPYCHSNYNYRSKFSTHLRQVHKLDANITKKAISLFTLFTIQDKDAATKYSCNDCNKWFGSLETVQRHYETACGQRVDVNVGACEYCNNVFHSNSELQMHHYNYHGIIENTLKPSIKSFTI